MSPMPTQAASGAAGAGPVDRGTAELSGASPRSHRSVMIILIALMLGMTLAALDQTIVATALPTIAADLGGLNHLSWVVTSYLLTSTIATPLWGKLGDMYGRKRLFQVSIVIFLAGSALSGLSQTMGELIAFRALQGIGAGGLMVGAQSIIGDVVSPRERGRYMGYFGAVFGVTSVIGPLLGGYFTTSLSWRWVFYINIPVGIAALVVIATTLHLPRRRTEHRVDYWGVTLLSAGVAALILLSTWGGTTYPWRSSIIIGLGVAGVLLLVVFVAVERRAAEPLLPLELFRNGVFNLTSLLGFIVGFAMFGAIVYLPLYFQTVDGVTPTVSGLEILPLMLGFLGMSILSGQIISRTGRYKIFPILGTGIMTVGLYLLSTMTARTSFRLAAVDMLIVGIGLGLVMQVLVIAVQNAVPYRQLGTATSLATFFRSIGGSFGVAILGAVFANRLAIEERRYLPPQALKALAGGNVTANPTELKALPVPVHHGFVLAFSHSLHTVFLVAVPVVAVAFVFSLFLREVPLRETAHLGGPEGSVVPDAPEGTGPAGSGTHTTRGDKAPPGAPDLAPDGIDPAPDPVR